METFNLKEDRQELYTAIWEAESSKHNYEIVIKKIKSSRSILCNRALHQGLSNIAILLNDAGLPLKKVMSRKSIDIDWCGDLVKEALFKPLAKVMFDQDSTTKLNSEQITKVYETLNKHLAENFGVSCTFPSRFG